MMWNICRAQCPTSLLHKSSLFDVNDRKNHKESSNWSSLANHSEQRTNNKNDHHNKNNNNINSVVIYPESKANEHTLPDIIYEQPNSEALKISNSVETLAIKKNMDSNNDHTMTEYKRQFQWNLPMMEPKIPKPEPMMSQYQIAFGHQLNSQPSSLTNSSNNSNDNTDFMNNYRSISNVIAPGSAIRNNVYDQEPVVASTMATKQQSLDRSTQIDPVKATSCLFDYDSPERSPSPHDLTKSEYHAKFKDFNEYVYVKGDGFKKGDRLSQKAQQMANSWFTEVKERSQQACKYRARSRNGATPVNPEYSWNGVAVKDRDLQALALATRLIIQEKKSERRNNAPRSVSAKPISRSSGNKINSAPPSLQTDSSGTNLNSKSVPRPVRKSFVKANDKVSGTAITKPPKVDKNNNNKSTVVKSATPTTAVSTDGSKKIWIKPVKKTTANTNAAAVVNKTPLDDKKKKNDPKDSSKNKIVANDKKKVIAALPEDRKFETEPKAVPLHTTQIKSPEEIAGIKSPSPESWKVTIEKGGLNWVNGNTPVNFGDGKSFQQNNDNMVRPVPINASINDDLYGPLSA